MSLLDSAHNLYNIVFPDCGHDCAAVKYFGVCECEAICPHKFDLKTGETKKVLDTPKDNQNSSCN